MNGKPPAPTPDVIRLIVVEDHPALRQGLELLLGRQGCVIIGSAGRAADAWKLIRARRPDVCVIDVNLPDESGVALAKRLLAEDPDLGVLLYTGAEDRKTLSQALGCGARGFAVKAAPPSELIDAIRAIARGGTYLDPRLKPMLAASESSEQPPTLSPREREVLALLSKGLTGTDAAARLSLSVETVRTHIRNAKQKLDANTRTEAIVIAVRRGEIDL